MSWCGSEMHAVNVQDLALCSVSTVPMRTCWGHTFCVRPPKLLSHIFWDSVCEKYCSQLHANTEKRWQMTYAHALCENLDSMSNEAIIAIWGWFEDFRTWEVLTLWLSTMLSFQLSWIHELPFIIQWVHQTWQQNMDETFLNMHRTCHLQCFHNTNQRQPGLHGVAVFVCDNHKFCPAIGKSQFTLTLCESLSCVSQILGGSKQQKIGQVNHPLWEKCLESSSSLTTECHPLQLDTGAMDYVWVFGSCVGGMWSSLREGQTTNQSQIFSDLQVSLWFNMMILAQWVDMGIRMWGKTDELVSWPIHSWNHQLLKINHGPEKMKMCDLEIVHWSKIVVH